MPFLQRFGAAAANGFKAVEILFPYEAPAADIAAELKKHKLTQALFNLPPGDASKGERGLAALPGREAEFSAALDTALQYAKVLECRTLHVMSGMIAAGADVEAMHKTFVSNLKMVCDRTAKSDLTIVLEPINHHDVQGNARIYLMTRFCHRLVVNIVIFIGEYERMTIHFMLFMQMNCR